MIKMKLPAGSHSVSFEGVEYKGKKGIVEVPEEAEQTLYSFGLLTVGKNEPDEEQETRPAPDPDPAPASIEAAAEEQLAPEAVEEKPAAPAAPTE